MAGNTGVDRMNIPKLFKKQPDQIIWSPTLKMTKDCIKNIYHELLKAKKKFPTFPIYVNDQVSIMSEESGESTQAALDYVYADGTIDHLEKELLHTAAMCLRCLENIQIVKEELSK